MYFYLITIQLISSFLFKFQLNLGAISQKRNYSQVDRPESNDRSSNAKRIKTASGEIVASKTCRIITIEGSIVEVPLGRGGKPKRIRTEFTQHQISTLKKNFESNNRMPTQDQALLAEELELDLKKVQTWFNNQRMEKKKKEMLIKTASINREFQEFMDAIVHAIDNNDFNENMTPEKYKTMAIDIERCIAICKQ